jgi:hypothetical protein
LQPLLAKRLAVFTPQPGLYVAMWRGFVQIVIDVSASDKEQFGRGQEELHVLRENNGAREIIPEFGSG